MKPFIAILLSIAQELEDLAKNSVPKIREGEIVKREWLEDGVYYRETIFDSKLYQAQFDFKKRKILYRQF